MPQAKRKGRPPVYKDDFPAKAEELCRQGATDREVAEFFCVSETTIWRWQHTHPAFCSALKVGKEIADDRVEKSLYRRAVGYSFDAVKIMQFQGDEVIVPYEEHLPPDTVACIFWLKNRRAAKWREKSEVEVGETLAALIEASMKRNGDNAKVIEHKPNGHLNGNGVGMVAAVVESVKDEDE